MPQQTHWIEQGLLFVFPSTPMAVRNALTRTLAALKNLELTLEERGTVELILAEALNNIVEHANAENPNGMIELQITPTKGGLCCKLRDDGKPIPEGKLPVDSSLLRNCDVSDLPEGGFGWFIIQNLAHDLKYIRSNGMNVLFFRIAVGQIHGHTN